MFKRYPTFKVVVTALLFMQQLSVHAQSTTETKINNLIKKMTLQEKIGMIHANSSFTSGGVKRLGIPELVMSDGPHGVRVEYGRGWTVLQDADDSGTYLPTGNTLAATWNPKLGYAYGSVLGSEAKYRGKDIILGPGINIIRTPLNGRNFEYFSEDPYLISKMAVGYIKGVQDQGISACVKHFAANNQEINRDVINVEMSERALRELYLPGFKAAVQKGQVNSIMGSYNKFRGSFATHNAYLMNDILKGEWGFKGVVISDWGSVHSTIQAIENGTDLEMGTDLRLMYNTVSQTTATTNNVTKKSYYDQFFLADSAIAMVKDGTVKESLIDDKVRRILRLMYKTNMISGKRTPGIYNGKAHQQVALRVAEEGIVLLKNSNNILPIGKERVKTIAVIGENAVRENAMGGGSSQVKAKYEITPLQGIKTLIGSNANISFAQGYKIARGQGPDQALIEEAVKNASKADVAILVCGWTHGYDYNKWDDNAYDAEAVDKPNMDMPFGQNELIKAVLKANPNTIIVLMGGGPMDISAWENDAKGIIQAWYPGMEGGNALAKIIFGEVNPSGKLPYTFPKKLADVPAEKFGEYPGINGNVEYKEGIFVGYRYYDTYKVEPQFPFGFGLSYTKFEVKNAKVNSAGNKKYVSVNIKNSGKLAGAEVLQLYVHKMDTKITRAEKELKSFTKVFLKPGETKMITFALDDSAFQYYDEAGKKWAIEAGQYKIMIGNSSQNILQSLLLSR
ncbi:beta-glucosidase [Pedobacter sp. UYP30]|uniref:glycoside hydrolase family 3 C-terminal domain-containing protein n=1 Tax=Pedobacter sp. UYP30 TaxID=1756400 RepID=UPI003397647E